MKLSDYAKESIVEAIKERYDEACEDLKKRKIGNLAGALKKGTMKRFLKYWK